MIHADRDDGEWFGFTCKKGRGDGWHWERIMHGLASHAHVRLQLYRGWNLQVVSVPSGALALGKMIIKEQKCLVSSVLAFLTDMWSGIKLRHST